MSKGNDQVVPAVPGTNVGGHDTSGVDGDKRTERSGELLGTPDHETSATTKAARELTTDQADFVAKEVDRANREDLPRLGGENGPSNWTPEEGGPPEFLANGAHVIRPARGAVTTADVPGTRAAPARVDK